MSTYHMASLHTKWSKQTSLPLGTRWGIPEGTSVADCLNWSYGTRHILQPQPPKEQKEQTNYSTDKRCYSGKTPVHVAPSSTDFLPLHEKLNHKSACDDLSIIRAAAPTPIHAAEIQFDKEVISRPLTAQGSAMTPPPMQTKPPTLYGMRARPPTPKAGSRDSYIEQMREFVNSHDSCKKVPINREVSLVSGRGRAATPQAFRNDVVDPEIRMENTQTPLTFKEYLRLKQRPSTPDEFKRMTAYMLEKKFGGYPHYHCPPTPEKMDYIIKETRSMKVRSPSPCHKERGVRCQSANGYRSPVTSQSLNNDRHEKAVLDAMREGLHSSKNVTDEYLTGGHENKPYSSSPDRRVEMKTQLQVTRPSSASHLDYYRKYKSSPYGQQNTGKSVAFPEKDLERYNVYTPNTYRSHTTHPKSAWNDHESDHFNEWRETTEQVAKSRGYDKPWNMKKHRRSSSRKGRSATTAVPRKVNVELDCPENADMMVSVRVKNTPVPAY